MPEERDVTENVFFCFRTLPIRQEIQIFSVQFFSGLAHLSVGHTVPFNDLKYESPFMSQSLPPVLLVRTNPDMQYKYLTNPWKLVPKPTCHAKDFTWNRGCSSNSPFLNHGDQIPHPLEDSDNQIPSSPGRQRCQMPGVCPGGGGACWSFDLTDTKHFDFGSCLFF